MGADWANFAVRFKEHASTDNWEERLHEVVKRIALFDPPSMSNMTGRNARQRPRITTGTAEWTTRGLKEIRTIWWETTASAMASSPTTKLTKA